MRVPGPSDLLRLSSQGYDALAQAIALVPRLVALVGQVEVIVARADAVITDIEQVQQRASGVVERTDGVVTRADGVVGRADALVTEIQPLLDSFTPTLDKLEPILARIVDTTSPDEVTAVVQLIDTLPTIVSKLDQDILPILDTLGTVAPDLRDLLDVSKELNEILGSVPGLGRVKKRVEAKQESQDAHNYRADEEPPGAPERGSSAGGTGGDG